MSAAVLTINPTIRRAAPTDPAVSEAAHRLRRSAEDVARSATSVLLDSSRYEAQKVLLELFKECSEPNWDGYGAVPPSIEGLRRAWNLLEWLPADIPAPQTSIHPDGEIALEWTGPEEAILTATLSHDPWIKWAAIIHGERLYGRIPYADSLPARLHRMVSEVLGPSRPIRRAR